LLAVGRWQLAAAGEEKEIALLFGGAFLFLYLDHRGHWDLGLARFSALSQGRRRILLGALLAVAAAVHLVNGLLFLCVLFDALLAAAQKQDAASARREAAWVLGIATLCCAPFFLWLAIGPGGARGLSQVLAYYFEYHLSGEFFTAPASLRERIVEAHSGFATWLLGELPPRWPLIEILAATAAGALLLQSALRANRGAMSRLCAWILLLAAHFFFYEPWHPEAWGTAGLALAVVLAVGILHSGRLFKLRAGLACICLFTLALLQVKSQRAAKAATDQVAEFTEAESTTAAPPGDLARWIDAALPRDAVIVVANRNLASYFLIYTQRRAVVRDYLDQTPQDLRSQFKLTTLSLRFYATQWTSAALRQAAQSGRPVYLIDESSDAPGSIALPFSGLRLSRY
jgi:hypothetical protein